MRLLPVAVLTAFIAACSAGSAIAEKAKQESPATPPTPTTFPKSDRKPVDKQKSVDPTDVWDRSPRKTIEPQCHCDDINCREYRPGCTQR